jgi:hypothetical protein
MTVLHMGMHAYEANGVHSVFPFHFCTISVGAAFSESARG